eukprot:357576-Pleurochrysis_carterae.AAC.1
MPLCIGQRHDNAQGIHSIIGEKAHAKGGGQDEFGNKCIADEVNYLHKFQQLTLEAGTTVNLGVKCCLDLAAARAMRWFRAAREASISTRAM